LNAVKLFAGDRVAERFALMNKSFLFDTGVTRNVFSAARPDLGERLWAEIQARNFLVTHEMRRSGQVSITTHATPLMLLEFLGISIQKIDPIPDLEVEITHILATANRENAGKAMERILDLISLNLEKCELLSQESLESKFSYQIGILSPRGKKHVQAMFSHSIYDESFRSYVKTVIALDRLQAIDFRKYDLCADTRQGLDLIFFEGLLACDSSSEHEISFARYIDQVYRHLSETKGPRIQIAKPYQTIGDAVDSEIIHLALLGRRNSVSRMPVAVFSTEKIDSWKPRILRYLAALKFLSDGLVGQGKDPIELTPGLIFRVDPFTGHLHDECLNMERVEDLTSFRITQSGFLKR